MARYFLHLRDGTEQLLDPEGLEFATIEAVRKAARGELDLHFDGSSFEAEVSDGGDGRTHSACRHGS